jgi:hypothetical protein
MTAYQPEHWQEMFVAMAGAAAGYARSAGPPAGRVGRLSRGAEGP